MNLWAVLGRRFARGDVLEPRPINFAELCRAYHPGKTWSELSHEEQVVLIRKSLRTATILIDPHCEFMKYWDLVISLALIFTGIVTPYEVIFMKTTPWGHPLFIVNRVVDSIFICDMAMQFFLKIEVTTPGKYGTVLIKDRKNIRNRYLKSWFPVDLISVAPFDVVFLVYEGSQSFSGIKILRCLRLLRLVKLVRMLKTSRLILRWQTYFAISFASQKLAKFSFILMLSSHWMACFWGLVGLWFGAELCNMEGDQIVYDDELPLNQVSWITTLFLGGKTSPDDPCNPWHVYAASLHWAVMTITSIGYGDIVPVRNVEYVACVICMLLGGVLWAYIIGSTCGLISKLDPVQSNFETSTDLLNVMMKEAGVLKNKRQTYREYLREAKACDTMKHFRDVASRFSPQLKGELLMHVSSAWTESVFYLKDAPQRLTMELIEALGVHLFSKNESLHDHFNSLCVVERGTLACAGRILTPGNCFHIDFIITKVLWRTFNMTISLSYSLIMALERGQFFDLSNKYPQFRRRLNIAAAKMAMTRCVLMCAEATRARASTFCTWHSLLDVFAGIHNRRSSRSEGERPDALRMMRQTFTAPRAQSQRSTSKMSAGRDMVTIISDIAKKGESEMPDPVHTMMRPTFSTSSSGFDSGKDIAKNPDIAAEKPLAKVSVQAEPSRSQAAALREARLEALEAGLGSAAAAAQAQLNEAQAQLNEVQRRLQELQALRREAPMSMPTSEEGEDPPMFEGDLKAI